MPSGSDVLNFAWIYFTSNTHQFGDILDNVDIFVGIKFWQESFALQITFSRHPPPLPTFDIANKRRTPFQL
jgi:hypothetical protein